ncbi:MAG TPA: tetraacyldisaccharide 4'-kinase [Gemmatimonadaceae bacterium]
MPDARGVERVWFGDGAGARAARLALRPLEAVYATAIRVRGALYDAGVLAIHDPGIPSVSVGNLSVGGTGKTPVAAWVARALRDRGAHPAIVLRGYGADEPLVHELLNPGIPVIAGADRVAGVTEARRRGADVAVLDDAFQHRRVRRAADIVLVSADRWDGRVRLLPAGPWRESLHALRRASLVLVTRKAVSAEAAERVAMALLRAVPGVARATAHLAPAALRRVGDPGGIRPLDGLAGVRVLALSAIGDPASFRRQLEAQGALVDGVAFPDHHAFTAAEVARIARRAAAAGLVVCTLKDAVKLAPLWPREAPPLWYVSQRLDLERGAAEMDALLARVLGDRPPHIQPVG